MAKTASPSHDCMTADGSSPIESGTAMSRGRGREMNPCLTVRKGTTEVTLSAAELVLCNSRRLRYAGRKHNVS